VRASRSHAAMRLEVNPLIGGERHGARASRPHAAMRLEVNPLIGGERHGARASRSHAAMRLEVNPLIGGERHGAGVSLACSDATHHGSESITPSTAPQSRNFYRDQKHVLLST